jgi:D-alanyl-D-alanine carboxypeptidase/D-alanyl-D-alanine-endopeptidase (penicillin-binding protein 4)
LRLLACFLLAAALPAFAQLPPTIADRLRAAGIPQDAAGVLVQRLSDGRPVIAHNADRSLAPASTLKLLTSLAALETLGPAWRGRTELLAKGPITDGVLEGDLVLRGMADVDLDWLAFEHLLQVLRLRGVREIRGDLLLDRTYFNPPRTDVGLPPFDEAPEFRYNFVPDALMLNTNLVHLDLVADGNEVSVAMTPQLEGVTVASRLKIGERACEDWEDGWVAPEVKKGLGGAVHIRLQGDFPRDCTAETSVNVIDRVLFVDRLFRATWKRLGGTFRGRVRDGSAPANALVLAEHKSRPLSEVVHDVNKSSDNPITRVLYLSMGAAGSLSGEATAVAAEREVRAWMARRNIDAEGLVLENGSGLSRKERIRPAQLAAVLRAAASSPWSAEFTASLPIVAVDGGMRTRLRSSPAAERARLKTGTLRDSSAVAGYVKDEAGETYVVVAILNHESANKRVARPILDALVDWVASRGRAGTPP